jgi:hypothetical protein
MTIAAKVSILAVEGRLVHGHSLGLSQRLQLVCGANRLHRNPVSALTPWKGRSPGGKGREDPWPQDLAPYTMVRDLKGPPRGCGPLT